MVDTAFLAGSKRSNCDPTACYATYSPRWIFLVEGATTAGVGILAFMIMPTYPVHAYFLTETEREVVVLANEADRALKAREDFSGPQIRTAFTDPRTYLWGIVCLSCFTPLTSVMLSLPSVVAGLGYKGTSATLMACPPYGLGLLVVLAVGWSVDRHGHRFEHYICTILFSVAALIVLMVATNVVVRYIMYFFIMFMYVLRYNVSYLSLTLRAGSVRL
jgi:hypothetical protein